MLWTDMNSSNHNIDAYSIPQATSTVNQDIYSIPPHFNNNNTYGSVSSGTEEEESNNAITTNHRRTNLKRKSSPDSSNEESSEEKRKNFLERNRQAALKCRQRKKQWLNNLQERVEFLANDNEQLQLQANVMRNEVRNLRNLLLLHKNCPMNTSGNNNIISQSLMSSHLLSLQQPARNYTRDASKSDLILL